MSEPFVGEIRFLPYNFAPQNWRDCDGSLLNINQYTALFSLLGTTYGGDGVSTFQLPDLRGRVPVHFGTGPGLSNYVLGQASGTETVTLLTNQIPQHIHTFVASTSPGTTANPAGQLPAQFPAGDGIYSSNVQGGTARPLTGPAVAGGSQPHENCAPTLAIRACISLFGVFPSRN